MNKIKAMANDIFAHWKTPAPGKYVSYKELVAYSAGGMGLQFIMIMFYNFAMSASCWLTGTVYGIKPVDMALILNIATIVAIVFQPLKGMMIDYCKKGKARPWILWLGPPTAILVIATAFINPAWDYIVKVALIGVAYVLLNILANFYWGQYLQLAQLISPNTDERATVISLSSVVYSLAPTITGFVMPLIASGFEDGLRDITVYRICFPVFCLLGLALSFLAYFGTKEKIVHSKQEVQKIKFWDGMKKVATNRYFWIINLSNTLIILRGAAVNVINWIWVYMLQNDALMALLVTVIGTASLIGMLGGPFLCKWIGKRWTVILTNMIALLGAVIFLFSVKNIALLLISVYLTNCAVAVQIITAPAMSADALDYQQWKTGDRLEGFSGNITIITSIIAIGINMVIPAFQEAGGLLNNYDVLFDPEVREPIFRTLCYISIIAAVVMSLPYLFWDLTEKKHKAIIEDLKQRAIDEDKAAGVEETPDELEARLAGITVEQLLAERKRKAENWASVNNTTINENNEISKDTALAEEVEAVETDTETVEEPEAEEITPAKEVSTVEADENKEAQDEE